MDKIVIRGGKKLNGEISISGAKNAVLPIMAAALLGEEKSLIENVPNLRDVTTMVKLLRFLGAKVNHEGSKIEIKSGNNIKAVAPYHLVSTMRASVCVLGPLLGRLQHAEVSMPGGCVIGARPIDLHLKGLRALGGQLRENLVCFSYLVLHSLRSCAHCANPSLMATAYRRWAGE